MNIFELKKIINSIIEYRKMLSSLPKDEYSKRFLLKEEITEMETKAQKGITIEDNLIKNQAVDVMSKFLERYGYSREFIKENIDETSLFISDINFAFNGKLVSFGKKIGIDYHYADFDEDGKFLELSADKKEEINHGIIHEFLHKCSIFRSDKSDTISSMSEDAFSEGITELLTVLITKSSKYKSEKYSFFVDVNTIFAELIGMDKLLDDYFNHIGDFPNIKFKFNEYGLSESEFLDFYKKMNRLLVLIKNNSSDPEMLELKKEIINFMQNNFDLKDNEKFNELFGEYFEKAKII